MTDKHGKGGVGRSVGRREQTKAAIEGDLSKPNSTRRGEERGEIPALFSLILHYIGGNLLNDVVALILDGWIVDSKLGDSPPRIKLA